MTGRRRRERARHCLGTATCAAALHAAITGAVSDHQRAAESACGCVSQTDDLAESFGGIVDLRPRLFPVRQFEEDSLLTFEESEFEPAKQIIHERLGVADLLIAGPTTGLKSRVAKLVAENLERHSVLQSERHGRGQRVHEPGNGRSFLGHSDEHFSRSAVFVEAYCDVPFLPAYRKVLSQAVPLIRKAPPEGRADSVRTGGFTGAVGLALGSFSTRVWASLLRIHIRNTS